MTLVLIIYIILVLVSSRAHPYDHYLLSCGSSAGDTSFFDGRRWSSDENFSTFSSPSSTVIVSADTSIGVPFTAARIFKSKFTYRFPVSPGPKFLRLFFYPTLYDIDFFDSHFFMSVHANHHLLLRNFSARIAVDYAPFTVRSDAATTTDPFVIKEYYITIPSGESTLKLTFSPKLPSNYAFVNGIEVVSVPDNLYVTNQTVKNFDYPSIPFRVSKSTALETAYRLNVGGADIIDGEISGMYRFWKNDEPYMLILYGQTGFGANPIKYTERVPKYTAPQKVYQTIKQLGNDRATNMKHNLTWRLKVDSGFRYMVRFHWCELYYDINSTNDRIFDVYLNGLMAERGADVMAWTGNQRYVPVYRDYVVFVKGSDGGMVDLWIALHPSPQNWSSYNINDVLLNGLEIFKMSKVDGSLDAPNPRVHYQIPSKHPTTQPKSSKWPKRHPNIIFGAIGVTLLISLLPCVLIFRRLSAIKQSSKSRTSTDNTNKLVSFFELESKKSKITVSVMSSHVCVHFSLSQIKLATNGFSEDVIIGHGGFGNVYGAILDGPQGLPIKVAIKRLNPSSKQGVHEFMTEIQVLSKIHHIHLVSLVGYCDDNGELILVYEYMEHGTLRDHLCDTNNPPLSWDLRLSICLGAAKGLHYLHAGVGCTIIHRDVKSTNILLDENWVPKVSDFGLSKLGPIGGDLHVSTAVKGSFGYLDPQYYMLQQLTEKSDVYSFGVVLFEVLCGRAAVNPNMPSEQVNLAMWARNYQQRGDVEEIVDPSIKDEITPACLRKFGEIAERCVRDQRTDRPSMADVVWSLELALELQQQTEVMSNCSVLSDDDLQSLSVSGFTSLNESQIPLPQTPDSTSHGECVIKMDA